MDSDIPPEIVSVEYVNEDTCKIGYRGYWNKISWEGDNNSKEEISFDGLIVYNSDKSKYYECKDISFITIQLNFKDTFYINWKSTIKWDTEKTILITSNMGTYEQTLSFKVP
jgi:hypothetical protein